MIRFGIIGTNFVTDSFVEALSQCDNGTIQAVYSRTIEKANEYADKCGAPDRYDSLEALANADNIDAVYVASPNALHCPQAVFLIEHGKHVLVEKAVASNSRELEEMLAASKKHGVVLLEAMRPVFDPGFQTIVDNLPKLGKIRRATFQYCQYSRRYDNFKKGIIENAFKPELSNGGMMDIGVYCIHPMVKLFGMPKEVHAHGILLSTGVDAQGTVLSIYEDMQVECLYSKITQSALPSQIQGEKASMIITEIPDTKEIEIVTTKGERELISIDKKENNMYYETKEFIRLIEEKDSAAKHNQYSLWAAQVMEEGRKQLGVVFPADK